VIQWFHAGEVWHRCVGSEGLGPYEYGYALVAKCGYRLRNVDAPERFATPSEGGALPPGELCGWCTHPAGAAPTELVAGTTADPLARLEWDHEPTVVPSVRICTADGQYVHLRTVAADEVHDLLDEFDDIDGPDVFHFDLDDGRSQVAVARDAIVRIDVDWELGAWSRFTAWALAKLDRWL
jgi:hypothetical protein